MRELYHKKENNVLVRDADALALIGRWRSAIG
jgi:hypothetical protein